MACTGNAARHSTGIRGVLAEGFAGKGTLPSGESPAFKAHVAGSVRGDSCCTGMRGSAVCGCATGESSAGNRGCAACGEATGGVSTKSGVPAEGRGAAGTGAKSGCGFTDAPGMAVCDSYRSSRIHPGKVNFANAVTVRGEASVSPVAGCPGLCRDDETRGTKPPKSG